MTNMAHRIQIAVQKELETIRNQHHGLLRARDVVEYARNPKTALHSKFEWNDSKAAQAHRLEQARDVIQVYVTVLKSGAPAIRTFVSLRTDRLLDGGGYRATVDVMSDRQMRNQLLAEALDEAERWQQRYATLTELVPIFRELARVRQKQAREVARPGRQGKAG